MSQATEHNITRRSLVAGLGAAVPAAAVAAVPALASAGDDAELIAIGDQLDRLYAQQRALMPEYQAASAGWGDAISAMTERSEAAYKEAWKPFDAAYKRMDAVTDISYPLEIRALELPAYTLAGVAVKARIHGAWIHDDVWAAPDEDRDWDKRLTCNLVEAVCRLAGVDRFGHPLQSV